MNSYKYIKQLPYCCVAACVEMILKRHNINHLSQEHIANDLGLILPESRKDEIQHYFKNPNTLNFITTTPKYGYGTQVNTEKYSFKQCIEKNNLPFKVEILSLKYYNLKEILQNKSENEDIILCFKYFKLYDKGTQGGHVSIFLELNNNTISILDPANDEPHIKKVNFLQLNEAIEIHEEGFGGVWKFTKINK